MQRDLTREYLEAFNDPNSPTDAVDALRKQKLKVLFVRGFLSEGTVKLGELCRLFVEDPSVAAITAKLRRPLVADSSLWPRALLDRAAEVLNDPDSCLEKIQSRQLPAIGEYFHDQLRWLGEASVDCECIELESEAAIATNARKISERLLGDSDILIVSHSKGCLDTLEALLTGERKRVKYWIAIQGPFAGAPVADFIVRRPVLRQAAAKCLRLAQGELAGLTDMETTTRRAYLERNAAAIERVLGEVRSICFASSLAPERLSETFLGPTLMLTLMLSGKNDGLVPADSAYLSNSPSVTLDDVDHAMPVMDSLRRFDRLRSLQALIRVRLT